MSDGVLILYNTLPVIEVSQQPCKLCTIIPVLRIWKERPT